MAGGNGQMMKLWATVAGALIAAGILGNYAYTRDSRQELREEVTRVETAAREAAREIKTDIRRELTDIKGALARIEDRLNRDRETPKRRGD